MTNFLVIYSENAQKKQIIALMRDKRKAKRPYLITFENLVSGYNILNEINFGYTAVTGRKIRFFCEFCLYCQEKNKKNLL